MRQMVYFIFGFVPWSKYIYTNCSMTHIAICIWGICRSTDKTIESVHTHIFKPLQTAGISYTVYVHTYALYRPYENPRAKEEKLHLKNSLWKLFKPDHSIVEDQDMVDTELQLSQYRTQGNPWNEEDGHGFQTLDNHIRALWSLNQVTSMWLPRKDMYTAVMYIRPDVQFLTSLHTDWIQSIPHHTIQIPSFHLVGGVNDRFAIGHPSVMREYGMRFLKANAYADIYQLHSEQFLSWILHGNRIQISYLPIKFRRIRANGNVCEADTMIGL